MKNILILILSCNRDFEIQEEQFLKTNWIEQLNDFPNITYYFYKKSLDTKFHVDKQNHILYVPCKDDSILGIFEKTILAFKLCDKLFDYDYIFRTNISTYVNIPLLNNFINHITNENAIYAPEILCSKEQGPFAYGLFPRGNGFIIHRKITNILTYNNLNRYKEKYPLTYNHEGCSINLNQGYIDDGTIGYMLCCYYIENNLDIFEHFKMYGLYHAENLYTYDDTLQLKHEDMNKCIAIQFKVAKNRNVTDEQNLANYIHEYFKHNKNDDISFILDFISKKHISINYNGLTDADGIKSVLKYNKDFNKFSKLNNYEENISNINTIIDKHSE